MKKESRARYLLPLILMIAALPLLSPAMAGADRKPPTTFGGWVSEWHPEVGVLKSNPKVFDSVAFCWFGIEKNGSLKRMAPPERDAIVAWSRSQGIKVFMTIGSGAEGITGKAGERAIKGIVEECEKKGFDGVDVDIEMLDKSARDTYTLFTAHLLGALKAMNPPRILSSTIQPVVNAEEEANSFMDYIAIGRMADIVHIMHYDEAWDEPGAIISRKRFKEELAFAASRIPLSKYAPALPWYGRDWNVTDKSHEDILWRMTEEVDGIAGMDQIVSKFGGSPQWREPEGELSLTYSREGKRHEVWMADAKQFAWMIDEARKIGAAGVYVWQIEYASPDFIPVVKSKIKRKK